MSAIKDDASTAQPDPAVYRLAPDHFRIMIDALYDLLGDRYHGVLRRALISLGWGAVLYLVGLALAAMIGFARVYVSTAAVYIVVASAIIVIDQVRALKRQFMVCLNETREAYLVSDEAYLAAVERTLRPGTARVPVFLVALLVFAPFALAILARYEHAGGLLDAYAATVLPPSFSSAWFTGSDLVVKGVMIGLLLVVISLILASVFFVSIVVVVGWPGLASRWPVVPVPSYIALRFGMFIRFFAHGMVIYAIAVLAAVLLYGGQLDAGLIALAAIFALFGLLCLLIPLHTVRQLVTRARAQVAAAVARRYRGLVYPVAASDEDGQGQSVSPDASTEAAYQELRRLEELMHAARDANDGVIDLIVIIPAILSQGMPFLGFLIPLVVRGHFAL